MDLAPQRNNISRWSSRLVLWPRLGSEPPIEIAGERDILGVELMGAGGGVFYLFVQCAVLE